MKVVVTGTSGRVGRAIHFALCRDHEVVGIDRAPSSATALLGGIDDFDLLLRAFDGADAVVHTAALHAPHVGLLSEEEFVRVNVDGTAQVVKAAHSCGVSKLVFTSTTALYGAASKHPDKATWIDEATRPEPRTIYHRTKLDAEELLESEASESLRVIVLRMSRCFPEPAPTMAVYRLHRGVDARDVAQGHRLALGAIGRQFQRYILSGATPFDASDCPALMHDPESVLRRKYPSLCSIFDDRGWSYPGSIDRVYDPTLVQEELGWVPRYGPEDVVDLLDAGHSEVLPPNAAGTRISE